jgi:hypothetical protein
MVYATEVTGVDDLKTWIRDVIKSSNRVMLASTWEELKLSLDAVHVTEGDHIVLH